jgi:hypothetical protein
VKQRKRRIAQRNENQMWGEITASPNVWANYFIFGGIVTPEKIPW